MSLLITRDTDEKRFIEKKREAEKDLNQRIESAVIKEITNFFDEAITDYKAIVAIDKANFFGFIELSEEMQSDLDRSMDFNF